MDRHDYMPGRDIPKVNRGQLTDHFGLVSDFLSSCRNHLRASSRLQNFQGRIQFGGALSGRDVNAAQKTMNGLLKLMFPSADTEGAGTGGHEIPDHAIEWAARLALECRRRVKEQQKRIGSAEFRNTHFSFQMGLDGVEQFVSTPELQNEDSIGEDPLPPGQIRVLSPGGLEEHPGLYRLDVTQGPESGVKILNQPPPAPFKESVRCAEQNLYTRAKNLVGDRDPRAHEFSVQMRAFDAGKSGTATGVGALLALCSALLEKSMKGGLIVVGGLTLGGSIEPVYNAVSVSRPRRTRGQRQSCCR